MLSSQFRDITLISESERGFSRVLRAQRMGKWHVLKCLKPQLADIPEYRSLLQKEFEIGYQLNHPNIVRTIGLEEVEGLGVCIVMEYVEGRTLKQFLEGVGVRASLPAARQGPSFAGREARAPKEE